MTAVVVAFVGAAEDANVRMWIAMPFAVGSRGIVLRSAAPWS
jgi:hypothetical protein